VEQVRARIATLREKTKEASDAKSFDFDKRLAEVKAKEDALREEKKHAKKAVKEAARMEVMKNAITLAAEDEMSKMMGFAEFGSSKR
jgi:U4/U6.U5 tri-snRNP component SNU23